MLSRARTIIASTADNYIASDSLTRGAAIAFYGVTSLIPVLLIVIAIAGLAFGEGAARGAIVAELAALIGADSAKLIQGAIENAYASGANGFALIIGIIILVLTVSGVFGELQSALNAIWKVDDRAFSLTRLISFGLTWTLFAAIYKVLPDKPLDWRDVVFGAFVTAIAFEGGKGLIGLYLGKSTVISSYGAAGALASVLV